MIKWIVAIKYKADRSRQACCHDWTERHGPLILEIPGLQRYVQSHRVSGEEDIGNAPYDGFESLWFENEAVAKQALACPQMAVVEAGAAQFADHARTQRLLAREVVMRDIPVQEGALKLVTFNYRKPSLSPQGFQDYWENQHGPLVLRHFAALRRYVQNHASSSCYESGAEPDFDGVLEAWLASFDALRAGEGDPAHRALRADEANFLDPDRFRFMLVRDQVRR